MIAAVVLTALVAADPLTVTVAGAKRTAEVYVPAGVKDNAPLVILLHGRFGTGAQIQKSSAFDAQALSYGFVVAYPDAIDRQWNDLRQVTKGDATVFDTRDVDFILALIDALHASHKIDKARVFVAGHSNGAMLTMTLACLHADKIAGVGAVAGQVPDTTCAPSRPVPAIFFHGTEDDLVPFKGGGVGLSGERGRVTSSDATVALFQKVNGCTSIQTTRQPEKRGKIVVVHERHLGCAQPVVRYRIEGGGHGWPGRGPILRKNTNDLDATMELAAFFALQARAR